ncbi:AAA family ATPase [Alkalihalophilus sp. As8PL]|uniref:Nuclease SbcCD subunit C n=1 Tax=Alkalihalophilus sp. As8PL TaxID=3237103 RepID=A0AB39BSP4_9BACI
MNNIESIRLENFQSHLDTTIEFAAGLNVLVGQSDSGKTAILRALRWVLFNQPRGTDFVRVGADFARVTVRFTHGVTIIRERTTSKNRYIIKEVEKEDLVLEGFGIHVPKEVLNAHGMQPLRIDRDHELMIHLSQQLDGPFLLEQTSSLRAKTIGRISGAHFLDMAIRDTSKDLSGLNQRVKIEEVELEQLKLGLEPYQALDAQREKLDATAVKLHDLKLKQQRLSELMQLKEQLKTVREEKERATLQFELVEQADRWEKSWDHIRQSYSYAKSLQHKRTDLKEFTKSIAICEQWIEKTKDVTLAAEYTEKIDKRIKQKQELMKRKIEEKTITNQLTKVRELLKKTDFIANQDWNVLDRIWQQEKRKNQLHSLNEQLLKVNEGVTHTRKLFDLVKHTEEVEERKEKLESLIKQQQSFMRLKNELKDVQVRINDGNHFMEEKRKEQEELEKEFEKQLIHIGTCPTCGSDLNART